MSHRTYLWNMVWEAGTGGEENINPFFIQHHFGE